MILRPLELSLGEKFGRVWRPGWRYLAHHKLNLGGNSGGISEGKYTNKNTDSGIQAPQFQIGIKAH